MQLGVSLELQLLNEPDSLAKRLSELFAAYEAVNRCVVLGSISNKALPMGSIVVPFWDYHIGFYI